MNTKYSIRIHTQNKYKLIVSNNIEYKYSAYYSAKYFILIQ